MPPETLFSKIVGIAKQGVPLLALFAVVVLGSLAADYVSTSTSVTDDGMGSELQDTYSSSFDGSDSCNVIGIEIRGCIATYKPDSAGDSSDFFSADECITYTSSEEVVGMIEDSMKSDYIKAVLLEIDSGGGSPYAAEEITAALKALGKPSVAWVRGFSDSAAYWIASGADTIVAGENSEVGSIGITYSFVDNAKQNQIEGLTYNQLNTGKYKDTGSYDKALTAEDRALIQRDLDIMYENFIRTIATNRNLTIDAVRALADGSTMLGAMAKERGLVDVIGTKPVVWKELETKIGTKPIVCWPGM
jgi:signal peptide peptidase SppA